MDNIIIYNTDDGAASVKLYANDGTVWLARAEIAALFQKDRSTISKHIKNIFAEGELDEKNNVHFLHIDNSKKPVAFYSLDVILAVGFRDRSRIAASKPNPFRPRTLLAGLLYCENCGTRYTLKGNYSGHGSKKRYYPYYYCYSRAKKSPRMVTDPTCMNPVYAVEKLDRFVVEEVRRVATDQHEFDAVVAAGRPDSLSRRRAASDAGTAIMHRLDEIDHQTARLLDLYQRGHAIDEIASRLDAMEEEKKTLQASLKDLQGSQKEEELGHLEPERAHKLLTEFIAAVDGDAPMETRRQLLFSLVEKIIVKRTKGNFDIYWKF